MNDRKEIIKSAKSALLGRFGGEVEAIFTPRHAGDRQVNPYGNFTPAEETDILLSTLIELSGMIIGHGSGKAETFDMKMSVAAFAKNLEVVADRYRKQYLEEMEMLNDTKS